jgi:hypothetical protein
VARPGRNALPVIASRGVGLPGTESAKDEAPPQCLKPAPARDSIQPTAFVSATPKLDADMKPAEIAEALSMLTFTTGDSRRTVGLDRETCRFIVERLRCG